VRPLRWPTAIDLRQNVIDLLVVDSVQRAMAVAPFVKEFESSPSPGEK
jgi:hypothetical protein